jgi:hypothetical protein
MTIILLINKKYNYGRRLRSDIQYFFFITLDVAEVSPRFHAAVINDVLMKTMTSAGLHL